MTLPKLHLQVKRTWYEQSNSKLIMWASQEKWLCQNYTCRYTEHGTNSQMAILPSRLHKTKWRCRNYTCMRTEHGTKFKLQVYHMSFTSRNVAVRLISDMLCYANFTYMYTLYKYNLNTFVALHNACICICVTWSPRVSSRTPLGPCFVGVCICRGTQRWRCSTKPRYWYPRE